MKLLPRILLILLLSVCTRASGEEPEEQSTADNPAAKDAADGEPGGGDATAPPPQLQPKLVRRLKLVQTPQPQSEAAEPGTGFVNFETLNAKGPTSARIEILDRNGSPVDFFAGKSFFYADCNATVPLPAGTYRFSATAGPRARRRDGSLIVAEKVTVNGNIVLDEALPVSQWGWQAFDPFVDAGSRNRYFSIFAEVWRAAKAEGVAAIGVAGGAELNDLYGTPYRLMPDAPEKLRAEIESAPAAGVTALAACDSGDRARGRIVALCGSAPKALAEKFSDHAAPLYELAAAARDAGGLAALCHPEASCAAWNKHESTPPEFLFDFVAGRGFDALDLGPEGNGHKFWFVLLDQGYRVAALAGGPSPAAKSEDDLPAAAGYVRLASGGKRPGELLDCLRTGQVCPGNGPFLRLGIDGAEGGQALPAQRGLRRIDVQALACSDLDDTIRQVDLIYNGKVLDSYTGVKMQRTLEVASSQEFDRPGWALARYRSRNGKFWAFTNPVYFTAPDGSPPAPVPARLKLLALDAVSGKPVAARAAVANLGSAVGDYPVAADGAWITVPATAEIALAADGYEEKRFSVYAQGGPQALLLELARRDAAALLQKESFDKLRTLLSGIELTIRLKPASPASQPDVLTPQ